MFVRCTLQNFIFQHSSWTNELNSFIYMLDVCKGPRVITLSVVISQLTFFRRIVFHSVSAVVSLSSPPHVLLYPPSTLYASQTPVRSIFSITIHDLLTKYDTFGETNIYSNLKHDISQCTIHILRQIILRLRMVIGGVVISGQKNHVYKCFVLVAAIVE